MGQVGREKKWENRASGEEGGKKREIESGSGGVLVAKAEGREKERG